MSPADTNETQSLSDLSALDTRINGQAGQAGDEGIANIEERAAPGLLRFMPALLQEFWAKKAYFSMDQGGSIQMEGFYKNGPMRLEVRDNDRIVAIDRSDRETPINSFDDLVALNYLWWKQSNTRNNYVVPQRPWIDSFLEKKLAKRKVLYVPVDSDEG